ncbi:polysaccharide biosynthesis protein [Acinetobacter chinensis]|uniref:Polysaccharide biosynthesis protein n=1 Tax=Acinetobacter chinensis TaxID=2004650 RepID=A0A3B7LRC1_9GAMM|nr:MULTISPECIES: oligosaccharide flippase family protein [Acinetobacter]AXY55322.1 polysaccharide biosynthesis protein [Acinetobacter chinensis]AXY61544.1 polysaccharide biosynthesis protein [Acinetobacter sp. WCHAc010052]
MKSLLEKVNAKLNAQGGFLKAVSVLVGGTAFAQLIGFLCLPILTRLYTPEDYSVLGVYVAIVSIFAVISCLRFDIAIPIPENESDGKALLLLSLLSNIILTIILYIFLIISHPYIQKYKIIDQLSYWIWLIPLGVFVSGLYSALQYWTTRHKRFKDISQTRMTQAVLGNGVSLSTGLVWGGFWGLILGQILNFSGGIFKLAADAKKDLRKVKSASIKKTFHKYSKFPKYSTFEALANSSAIQLPLIVIAGFLAGSEVGYLMMAMKLLGVPMTLIGSSMSQVYLSQAPHYYINGGLYDYTISILIKIFKIIIIPFVLLALISSFIFDFIFGIEWAGLGKYILIMIPWYFMQILSSPISMALHIVGFQKIALILQVFGFLIRVGVLFALAWIGSEFVIDYYIFSGFLFYFIYMLVVIWAVKKRGI